jgi:hypothetical protein
VVIAGPARTLLPKSLADDAEHRVQEAMNDNELAAD